MEHDKIAKSHGISLSVMGFSFTNFVPELFQILSFLEGGGGGGGGITKRLSIDVTLRI